MCGDPPSYTAIKPGSMVRVVTQYIQILQQPGICRVNNYDRGAVIVTLHVYMLGFSFQSLHRSGLPPGL